MTNQRKGLIELCIPIALETFLFMFTGIVDTLMLSTVGDQAVGAVGTANTYMSNFTVLFNIASAGMVAVMTQFIGAKKIGVAYQARQMGLVFNAILGGSLSIFLVFFAGDFLEFVGVAPALLVYAKPYLQIVGGGCILMAMIPVFSSYLRAFGYTKFPLIATLSANVINLGLNAFFLFVMGWGTRGVAIATVISRCGNLAVVAIFSAVVIKAKSDSHREPAKKVFGQIIRVGLPAAAETALYNVAMTLTIRFLNQMDEEGINVTVRSYANTICNFSYCIGAAMAQANAIMTGWRIGAKEYEACDKGTRRAAILGVAIAVTLELIFATASPWIMTVFTEDAQIIALVQKVLYIDAILEAGRVTNLVYGQSLKTSGDAIFPAILAAIFMYLCMVGGTYFFGIHLGLMVIGAYIALASDECMRAVGMYLRWNTGKWRQKGFTN